MKNYELLYILPASLTSEEIVKNFEEVKAQVEKFGAVMLETLLDHPFLTKAGMPKDEEPDELKAITLVKRKLAYPIKHEKFGFYCLINFSAEPKKMEEIDEYLRLNHVVLRHLVTQADPMTKEQLETLETLFARKKAEQEKEEAEKKSSEAKEEPKRIFKREETKAAEVKTEAPVAEAEVKEEAKEEAPAVGETKEEVKEEAAPEAEPEEKAPAVEEKEEKKEKKTSTTKKEDGIKEEKKTSRKSKIKLEELEDKLDEILEDTII